MNKTDITFLDASALAERIRTRALSSVEVVQAHLDRIAALNPKINAVVDHCARSARRCPRSGRGGPRGSTTWTVARRSLHRQRQHRHCWRADSARFAHLSRAHARLRRGERGTHEEGRRNPACQDQPAGILLLDREQQPTERTIQQPMGPVAHAGRFERWGIRGHCRRNVTDRTRNGPRNIRARASRSDGHRFAQGHARPRPDDGNLAARTAPLLACRPDGAQHP